MLAKINDRPGGDLGMIGGKQRGQSLRIAHSQPQDLVRAGSRCPLQRGVQFAPELVRIPKEQGKVRGLKMRIKAMVVALGLTQVGAGGGQVAKLKIDLGQQLPRLPIIGSLLQQLLQLRPGEHRLGEALIPRQVAIGGHQIGAEAYDEPELRQLLLDPPAVMGVQSIDVTQFQVRMVARTLPGKQFDVGRILRARVAAGLLREGISLPAGVETIGPNGAG